MYYKKNDLRWINISDNKTVIGLQYMRRCESKDHAHKSFQEILNDHGVHMVPLSKENCDPDGSYNSLQKNTEGT